MKRKHALVAICLAVMMLASCSRELSQSEMTDLGDEVLAVHDQMVEAIEKADFDGLSRYVLHSKETVIEVNGSVQTPKEAAKAMSEQLGMLSMLGQIEYTIEEKQLLLSSQTTAEVQTKGSLAVAAIDGSILFAAPFEETLKFVRTHDGWKARYIKCNIQGI